MKEQKPSTEQWQKLYALAAQLYALAPWQWLYDNDIFAVSDPMSDDFLYISVMGQRGEHFAVGVYPGQEGYSSLDYLFCLNEYEDQRMIDLLIQQKCIKVSFEVPLEAYEEFQNRAQDYGYLLGSNIPEFLSFEPGFLPWPINRTDAIRLITVLEQTLEVGARSKGDKKFFDHVPENMLFTRLALKQGSETTWQNIVTPRPEPMEISLVCPEGIPTLEKEKISQLQNLFVGLETWEYDVNYTESPIDGRPLIPRPYYPKIMTVVDEQTGFVYSGELGGQHIGANEILKHFVSVCLGLIVLPKRILVQDQIIYDILSLALAEFEVEVELVEYLTATQAMMRDMDENFRTVEPLKK